MNAKGKALKKVKMTERGGIVRDPSIPRTHFTDYDYEDEQKARKQYYSSKGKAKPYLGK